MSMDMSMGLGGMATQIGMGLTNIGHSAIQAKRARAHQRNMWERSLRWGPGIAVQGLRMAGLNPILAAQSGYLGGAAPSSPGTPAGGMFGDPMNSAKTASLISAQVKDANALAGLHDAQREIIEAGVPTAQLKEEVTREGINYLRGKIGKVSRQFDPSTLWGTNSGKQTNRELQQQLRQEQLPGYDVRDALKRGRKYWRKGFKKATKNYRGKR